MFSEKDIHCIYVKEIKVEEVEKEIEQYLESEYEDVSEGVRIFTDHLVPSNHPAIQWEIQIGTEELEVLVGYDNNGEPIYSNDIRMSGRELLKEALDVDFLAPVFIEHPYPEANTPLAVDDDFVLAVKKA